MAIKAGWYGWVEYEGERRRAFVANVGNYGELTLELGGWPTGTVQLFQEEFQADPEAMFWAGHIPDLEEHLAAKAKVRGRMIAEGWSEVEEIRR